MNLLEAMWRGGFGIEDLEKTFHVMSVGLKEEMIIIIGEEKLNQWTEQQKVILDDIKNKV